MVCVGVKPREITAPRPQAWLGAACPVSSGEQRRALLPALGGSAAPRVDPPATPRLTRCLLLSPERPPSGFRPGPILSKRASRSRSGFNCSHSRWRSRLGWNRKMRANPCPARPPRGLYREQHRVCVCRRMREPQSSAGDTDKVGAPTWGGDAGHHRCAPAARGPGEMQTPLLQAGPV